MKESRPIITVGVLLIVAAIVLGGCGGGGDRLTKEEFAAKVNQLCLDNRKKTEALGAPKGTAATVKMLRKYNALFGKMVADLKKLRPPNDEQAAVDRLLTIAGDQLDIVDRMITAAKKNDSELFYELVKEGDATDNESNRIFRRLGITACKT